MSNMTILVTQDKILLLSGGAKTMMTAKAMMTANRDDRTPMQEEVERFMNKNGLVKVSRAPIKVSRAPMEKYVAFAVRWAKSTNSNR